jgi:transposase
MVAVKRSKKRAAARTARLASSAPTRGGTRGYSQDTRSIVLQNHLNGDEHSPIVEQLQEQGKWPSRSSTWRWRRRMQQLGHARAFVSQGNSRATALRGHLLVMMAWYRAIYPKVTAHEMNAFLFNASDQPEGQRRLYHPSQISRMEDRLGLSRKAASTTARQANHPRNLQKRWQFWNMNYPYGIADIAREDLIDLDEAGIFLETCNRGFGKCFIGKTCREEGPYGHSEKWTLTMAISGGPDNSRWVQFEKKSGTTIVDFAGFIQMILDSIPPGNAERRRCFIMDNLSAHQSIVISQIIRDAGHRLAFRAPYHPVDGPIEYLFNTIQQALTMKLYEIYTSDQLQAAMNNIITSFPGFTRYFTHCGY